MSISEVYRKIKRLRFHNASSSDDILDFWRSPNTIEQSPEVYANYLTGHRMSMVLMALIEKYKIPSDSEILEIGCNVGRNLNYLFNFGYKRLYGIEINEDAVKAIGTTYPYLMPCLKVFNAPVEDVIKTIEKNRFPLVFTTAVLYHIHYNSEWIFPHIVRITSGTLITIENEYAVSDWRHFPRDYRKVFEPLGMKQVESSKCNGDLAGFVARVFRKKVA